jgi:hypothetical protein
VRHARVAPRDVEIVVAVVGGGLVEVEIARARRPRVWRLAFMVCRLAAEAGERGV